MSELDDRTELEKLRDESRARVAMDTASTRDAIVRVERHIAEIRVQLAKSEQLHGLPDRVRALELSGAKLIGAIVAVQAIFAIIIAMWKK